MPGAIVINTFTATETTGRAIDLALDVLQRFGQKGVSEEQLTSAKAYYKGLYPTGNLETSAQLAAILCELELYGLDRGEIDQLFERIDSVTVEQANAVIKRHYRSDKLQFVILGDAARIRETVSGYAGEPQVLSVAEPGFGPAE